MQQRVLLAIGKALNVRGVDLKNFPPAAAGWGTQPPHHPRTHHPPARISIADQF